MESVGTGASVFVPILMEGLGIITEIWVVFGNFTGVSLAAIDVGLAWILVVVFIVTELSVCNILERIGRVNVIEKLVAFLTVVKASGNFLALSEKTFLVLEAVPEAIGNDFAVAGNAIWTVGVVAVSIGTKFLLVVTTSVILGAID